VAKLVASLVDNSGQTPGKTEDQEERKRLKKQHEQISKCPHNPKVEGSNPSPAIGAANKRPFFIAPSKVRYM